eukprot:11522969-Alexandrium_andersonii.AAC.1
MEGRAAFHADADVTQRTNGSPLRGCGEQSTEHLLLRCLAVVLALRARANGTPRSLVADPDASVERRRWLAA